MPYHTNLRRVFPTWERAVEVANAYGIQTGVKHRVYRQRGAWRVASTKHPVTYLAHGQYRKARLP